MAHRRAVPQRHAQSITRPGLQRKALEPGLIFDIAREAGIEMRGDGETRQIRCRFHDDRNASAFVSVRNVFFCSVCTPGGGWTAKRFAKTLGLPWPFGVGQYGAPRLRPVSATTASELRGSEAQGAKAPDSKPAFAPEDAKATWQLALARASRRGPADRAAVDYLRSRGLEGTLERGAAGILTPDMRPRLHPSVAWWPGAGYQLVAPLYDGTGRLACVQARSITNPPWKRKKVQFPKGCAASKTRFASPSALEILRGELRGDAPVLIGEGLTDFLALLLTSPVPIMSAPGVSLAAGCIGPWAKGRRVYLALDGDEAGERAWRATFPSVLKLGGEPFKVTWDQGRKDACDLLEKEGRDAVATFLAQCVSAEAVR